MRASRRPSASTASSSRAHTNRLAYTRTVNRSTERAGTTRMTSYDLEHTGKIGTCRTLRSQDHRRLYNARTLDEGQLRQLLRAVARGELPTEDAVRRLTHLPFEDLGFARVDHHRSLRALGPEVVYARGKTPEETSAIVSSLLAQGGAPVLVTKASQAHADALLAAVP